MKELNPKLTPNLNAIELFKPESSDLPPFADLLSLARVSVEDVVNAAKDENTPAEWQGLMVAEADD